MFNLQYLPIVHFFWIRHRTCWRKVKHANQATAARIAKRTGPNLHEYKCPYCKKWHVGHLKAKRLRP